MRLTQNFPDVFNYDNFQDIPIHVIQEYIRYLDEQEFGFFENIGRLTAYICLDASQATIKEGEMDSFLRSRNPYAQSRLVLEARDFIDPATASVFLELMDPKKCKVPAWVWSHIPKSLIKAAV